MTWCKTNKTKSILLFYSRQIDSKISDRHGVNFLIYSFPVTAEHFDTVLCDRFLCLQHKNRWRKKNSFISSKMGKRIYFKCLYFQAWEQNMDLLCKSRFSLIIHFLFHPNSVGFIILQGETSYFQNNQFKIIFPGRVLRFGCQTGASNRICRGKFKYIFKFDCVSIWSWQNPNHFQDCCLLWAGTMQKWMHYCQGHTLVFYLHCSQKTETSRETCYKWVTCWHRNWQSSSTV